MSSTESPEEHVQRLKFLLEQLNLEKYSSLSNILGSVFESTEKFNEFIDTLNNHVCSEELISKKLSTLYDYVNELPNEEDLKNIVSVDKLQQIASIIENHCNCVHANNNKAKQLEMLYNSINTAYMKIKTDVDTINKFMEDFNSNSSTITRYIDDKPLSSVINMNLSFSTKIDTSLFYNVGSHLKFIEIREDIAPMMFYTPLEFVKGYIQNDDIVLDQGMKYFYLFSSETEVYDIQLVNSNSSMEDTEYEINQYKNYEFEIQIYTNNQQPPMTTTFTYYGAALGVTFTPGCKFCVVFKGSTEDSSVTQFMFPKYMKLKFTEIKTNTTKVL